MKQPQREAIYRAAERFVDQALRSDGSLFTPGEAIWSAERIEDVYRRFNLQPDETGRSFTQKLKDQLSGAPPETYQLFGELVYVTHLVALDIRGRTKRRLIEEILNWSPTPVSIPKDLSTALDEGLASTSLAFKTLRPFQLSFLVEFFRKWKALPEKDRAALEDPWRFKELVHDTPIDKGYAMRETLKHLVFPGVFEDIVSREMKHVIASAFSELIEEPTDDTDRQLLQIREKLQEREGGPISLYDPRFRAVWSSDAGDPPRWDAFFTWGKRLVEREDFKSERRYKIEVAKHFQQARLLLLDSDPTWIQECRAGMQHKDNNLADWRAIQAFMAWLDDKPQEAEATLRDAWARDKPFTGRLGAIMEGIPEHLTKPSFFPTLSLLMMAVDPYSYPPFRATPLKTGYELTGYPPQGPGADFRKRYRHAVDFFERMREEGQQRGVKLRDALDAQSLLWRLTSVEPPEDWSEEEKREFLRWRDGTEASPPEPVAAADKRPRLQPLESLAARLYVPEEFLTDVLTLLRDKKQIVFYGPPGTGKTYVARNLIEHLAQDRAQWEIVQFHPSYSYEDFVQGYRPESQEGQLTYTLRKGPLMRLAERAAESPDQEFFLLIDEINRGNLPRIFGELLYLLEYRGDEITLMYEHDKRFVLPPNLLIIGTMNTADRSIGLVDAALRRRFHFIALYPEEEPLTGLLGRWLEDARPEMAHVAGIVERLNGKLRQALGRHLQVGHSHFMKKELDEEILGRVWEHDILPFLEDQFYGHDKELEQYQLKRLRERVDEDDHPEGASTEDRDALSE